MVPNFARQIVEDALGEEPPEDPKAFLRGMHEAGLLTELARRQGMKLTRDDPRAKVWAKDVPVAPPLMTPRGKAMDILRLTLRAISYSPEPVSDKNYDYVELVVRFGHEVEGRFLFLVHCVMRYEAPVNVNERWITLAQLDRAIENAERVRDSGTVEKAMARLRPRMFRKVRK